MTSSANRLTWSLLIALTSTISLLSLPTQAQYKAPQKKPETPPMAAPPDEMKDKISLPDVPEYTGLHKFVNGFIYHVPKQGPSYVMTFNVKEDRQTVIEWWKNTLKTYRWNILSSDRDAVIASNKEGNMCAIQISAPAFTSDKTIKCSYQIRYVQKER
jgi:hypothetical protein